MRRYAPEVSAAVGDDDDDDCTDFLEPQTGWLNQQKFTVSSFRRPEAQAQGVGVIGMRWTTSLDRKERLVPIKPGLVTSQNDFPRHSSSKGSEGGCPRASFPLSFLMSSHRPHLRTSVSVPSSPFLLGHSHGLSLMTSLPFNNLQRPISKQGHLHGY